MRVEPLSEQSSPAIPRLDDVELVKRLRSFEGIGAALAGNVQYVKDIMDEAADTIERLLGK